MMIDRDVISSAMYEAMRLAATQLPPDVDAALVAALEAESDPLARRHIEVSLENARAAAEGYLRPTMVDPLTRANPGDNIGPGMPRVLLSFEGDGDGLEITAAPKGGGSEIFGTFYRMMYPSDGEAGILSFVLDAIREGCYAGKICPPAIVGVGIGGTADLCMALAKEAAVLRPIGVANPDPNVAALERKLFDAARNLGIGAMGAAGTSAVMAVNVETAVTHTAALPVAVNAQCLVGRRWRASISASGDVSFTGDPA